MRRPTTSPLDIQPDTLLIDIASRNVAALAPDNTLGEAAQRMAELRISSLLVADAAGHPLGIVTESTMLQALLDKAPHDTPLHKVMAAPVISVPADTSCLDAYHISLQHGIRHLAVVDTKNCLLGIVSETDFRLHINLRVLAGYHHVTTVMQRSALCLGRHEPLPDALRMMRLHHDNCVVVTEQEIPVGILTERDIVRLYSGTHQPDNLTVEAVMTTPVLTIPVHCTAHTAADRMLEARVRQLVVVDPQGKMVGLVTEHDLTQVMVHSVVEESASVDSLFLGTLINTIPDLVWLKDADGKYLACNTRFEQFFGSRAQEIAGKTDYDFTERQQADAFRDHDRMAMAANQPTVNEEWVTFASDGHRELLETVKTPMRDRNGELIGVLGVARDITERKRTEDELRQSIELIESVINAIPDLLFELDLDGRYINVWARDPAQLSNQREILLGHTVNEMLPAAAAQVVMLALAEAHANGSSSGQVIMLELPHGKSWFELSTAAKLASGTDKPHFIMLSRDITQRLASEANLRASEEKLRSLYEVSPMGIALTDMQGRYIEFNEAFRQICGYTREELNQLDYWELTPKEYADQEAAQLDSLSRTGYYGPYEKEYLRKDGNRIPLRLNGMLIHDSHGEPFIWSIVEDISASRQAAAILEASEARFRTLVENSPFCIHEVDLEGCLQSMNPAGLQMLGLSSEAEILGRSYFSLVSTEDTPRIAALLQDALHGTPSHFEFSGAGESPLYFKSCFIPIRNSEARVIRLMGITEDISERKRTEDALRQREEIFSAIVNQAADSIVLIDTETLAFAEFNQMAHESLGYTRAEFSALRVSDIQAQLSPEQIRQRMQQSLANSADIVFETLHRRKDGSLRETEVRSRPIRIHGKQYVSGIWSDITQRKRDEQALRITASVFDTTHEAILITDAENIIMDVNPAFSRITGYSRAEVLGRNPKLLSSGHQDAAFYQLMWKSLKENKAWRGEIWNRRKSGEVYAELLSISSICDSAGQVQRYVAVFSDITRLKDHEAELSRIANYDALTGVPNRRLLADRLRQAIAHAKRNHKTLAICYLDLDGFKDVNDRYGHEAGDKLLIDIAHRLQEELRAGDTLARLGGDEFVVLLNDMTREQECFQILERILHIIAAPVSIGKHRVSVSASIGVTFYPSENDDGDTLLRHADQAMYVAKQTGKNRYHVFDSAHDQRVRALYDARTRILDGLEQGEFELYYQPKIELATGSLIGVEALLRWHHPERGLLLPAEFLPLAEGSDLEIQIGNWVLEQAMSQLDAWHRAGLDIEVSINISAYHLQSPDFVSTLEYKLIKHPDLPRNQLQIEILETAALENISQSAETIDACRRLGIRFALDDFGTGFSSLTYLRKLSAETIKIDQSFVRGILTDEDDLAIVQGIVALAKGFGRKTVAEGIEATELIQKLIEVGCIYGQGFGISQPMPAKDFMKWQEERQ